MDAELQRKIAAAITRSTSREAEVVATRPVGGGCINNACEVELGDGRRFFVKSNSSAPPRFFESEAEGLEALAEAAAIRVPAVVAWSPEEPGEDFIVLERIDSGRPGPGFFEDFGRRFADLHRRATSERYGFERDNYIGSTLQLNRWTADWTEFWRRNRLAYQLDLARRNGLSDPSLDRLGDRLLDRLDELIAEPAEEPCLVHGDLWSGNFMADHEGAPVLIDPAAYFGRREADLAMTLLFGGFDRRFYDAYEETWPLEPGSEDRLAIYKLYHLLNHLNLFGGGYHAGCLNILRRFA